MDVNTLKVGVVDKGQIMADSGFLFVVEKREVRALERRTKRKVFELEVRREEPRRVEVWGNDVIVGTEMGVEFYDRRKVTRPATIVEVPRLRDFLYDPNIERAYVSTQSDLICFGL